MTEEDPNAGTYRQDLWAELSDSRETPAETSILLLEALRTRFAILVRQLKPVDLARTFVSPTHGRVTLERAIQMFAWHGRHHLAQITGLRARMGW